MRTLLKSCLGRIPVVGPGLIAGYRRLSLMRRLRQHRSAAGDEPGLDADRVYWIDPHRIRLHTDHVTGSTSTPPEDRVFDPIADRGKVYDGDWDLSGFEFRQLEVYRALEDVIQGRHRWEQTAFYQTLAAGLGTGSNPWSVHSLDDLRARCAYLDRLIASLREHGYKRSHEISLPGEPADPVGKDERHGSEISVNVGRDGLYLFQDGRHRLAIAQILGLPEVPVKVLVRHRQWVEFRRHLEALARSRSGATDQAVLYQPPCHPDLADIPAAHGCQDRMQAIRQHLAPATTGSALDIGANLGYFCHGLEDLGLECVAVEHQPQIAAAAEAIRDAERKRFRVVTGDLFAATESGQVTGPFEVVLALNIFHHFLKEPATYEQLRGWLAGQQISQMFFEPHRTDESQMQGAYHNYSEAEFIDFLLSNSTLTGSEFIHRCEDGRSLYRLWS